MRRGLIAASFLVAGVAHAQPGAPPDGRAMDTYRLEAREAALRGDCTSVATIARLVADVDASYYRDVFLRDTVVASCNAGVGSAQLPPGAVPPVAVPLAAVPPQGGVTGTSEHAARPGMSDTGRGVGGMFVGLGAGFVAGIVGAYIAGTIADKAHPDCASFCDEVIVPAVIGFQVGANIGLAAGITAVGNHKGGKGSFGTSLTMGLVGSGVSWLFALNDETIDNGMFGVAFFTLPVLGTMSGYWFTHEHTDIAVVPTANGVAVTGRF